MGGRRRHEPGAGALMLLLPEAAGPMDPVPVTPARPAGSIRRTSSIDTSRPDGLSGPMVITAQARDLLTADDGSATEVARTELVARLDGTSRQILALDVEPAVAGLDGLVGTAIGPGFRGRMIEVLPRERDGGTLLHLLLDDLPGATLVSGYALQRGGSLDGVRIKPSGESPPTRSEDKGKTRSMPGDICAGWATDATLMVTIRTQGVIPVSLGPPAPVLESPSDPWAWHAMEALPPQAMRRRRRLDLIPPAGRDAAHRVDVHFRDSYVDPDGAESVVHEYSVFGTIDVVRGQVVDMEAVAQVLPWMECPGALASAHRLAGVPLSDLRDRVRREWTGASTCTHLNDTLRSLGDVPTLAQASA
jgi:Protein of unknown function (DUF2889)